MENFFKNANRKEAVSWAFYDFANSAYALFILSFVFPIFFRDVITGEVHWGFWWGFAISVSILIGGCSKIFLIQRNREITPI